MTRVSPRWEDPRTVAGFIGGAPNEQLLAYAARDDVEFLEAPMAPLPFQDGTFDLIVAHGIWNLAHTDAAFRAAVAEAGRVARDGAGLFVFTFSRHTLADDAAPDAGESLTFSSWNGEPQVFLRKRELIDELAHTGLMHGADDTLVEYNRPAPGAVRLGGPPVIYEATFTKRAIQAR